MPRILQSGYLLAMLCLTPVVRLVSLSVKRRRLSENMRKRSFGAEKERKHHDRSAPSMLDLVVELHKSLDRLGPGSVGSTNRALDFVEGLGSMERVLDLGCGTGAQTMTLVEHIPGSITVLICSPILLTSLTFRRKRGGWAIARAACRGLWTGLMSSLKVSTSFGARAQLTVSGSRRCPAAGTLSSSRMATWPLHVRRGLSTIA